MIETMENEKKQKKGKTNSLLVSLKIENDKILVQYTNMG
jgi:hypothetical protein